VQAKLYRRKDTKVSKSWILNFLLVIFLSKLAVKFIVYFDDSTLKNFNQV